MGLERDEKQFLKDLEDSYLKETSQIIQKEIDFSALQKKIFNLLKRFELLEGLLNKGAVFATYQKNFLTLLTESYSLIMRLTESLKNIKFNYLLFIEGSSAKGSLLREYTLEDILSINGLLNVIQRSSGEIRLVMNSISKKTLGAKGQDFKTEEIRQSIFEFYQSLEGLLYSTTKNKNGKKVTKKANKKLTEQFNKLNTADERAAFRKKNKVSSVVHGSQLETAVEAALQHLDELQNLSGIKLQRRLIQLYSTDSAIFYSRGDVTLRDAAGNIERELQLKNLSSGMAQVAQIGTLKKTLITISYYIIKADREKVEPKKLVSELLAKEDKISKTYSEAKDRVVKAALDEYFKEFVK